MNPYYLPGAFASMSKLPQNYLLREEILSGSEVGTRFFFCVDPSQKSREDEDVCCGKRYDKYNFTFTRRTQILEV